MSNKIDNFFLSRNECSQANIFVITQSLAIIMHIGFFLAVLIKTKVTGEYVAKFIGFIIILIVLMVLVYYLIKYLCKNGHTESALAISILPFLTAPFSTYSYVSSLINRLTD